MPEESEEASPKWVAVGNSIKNGRAQCRMSRNRLAERSGVPISTLQEIENHTKVRNTGSASWCYVAECGDEYASA